MVILLLEPFESMSLVGLIPFSPKFEAEGFQELILGDGIKLKYKFNEELIIPLIDMLPDPVRSLLPIPVHELPVLGAFGMFRSNLLGVGELLQKRFDFFIALRVRV